MQFTDSHPTTQFSEKHADVETFGGWGVTLKCEKPAVKIYSGGTPAEQEMVSK